MSPTKQELAEDAKVNQLRQLAGEYDVDLEGATTKDAIVEKIVASNKVTKDTLDAVVNADGETGDGAAEAAPGHAGPQGTATGGEPNPAGSGGGGPGTSIVPAGSEEASRTGMVTDEQAAERVEGRTSDASMRLADERAAETPRDITDGPKPSDAGAEDYPFPTAGDVDVASIPKVSSKVAKAEYVEPLDGGDVWVRLGDHDDVPEELQGHLAVILEAPTMIHPKEGVRVADTSKPIVVRTRDEHDARLQVPYEALAEISRNGRAGLLSFA